MWWWASATLGTALLLTVTDAVDYDSTICGESEKYNSPNGAFSYGSNAWDAVGDGFQCVGIQDSVPAFDATWMWEEDRTNVHSFPHVRFLSDSLPARMTSIRSLHLRTDWFMSLQSDLDGGTEPRRALDSSDSGSASAWASALEGLNSQAVRANVAYDFFADPNKTMTYNPVDASTEIMIWLAQLDNAQPLKGDSPLTTMEVGGVQFDLWYARNFRDHDVFTWMPSSGDGVLHFDADVAPMLEYIRTSGHMDENSWLGLAELGTETWHSPVNVTFTATGYAMELDADDPANADNGQDNGAGDSADDEGAADKRSVAGLFLGVVVGVMMWNGFALV